MYLRAAEVHCSSTIMRCSKHKIMIVLQQSLMNWHKNVFLVEPTIPTTGTKRYLGHSKQLQTMKVKRFFGKTLALIPNADDKNRDYVPWALESIVKKRYQAQYMGCMNE